MKEFSFIVPIYNVESYLRRCVDSLIKQTYDKTKIEIILVDDGSPDGCGEICDEYSKLFSNVIAYHKKNGGLSEARNYGLMHATKEYIIFVDADDYISLDTCRLFNDVLSKNSINCDVVTGGVMRHVENKEEIWNTYDLPKGVITGSNFLLNRLCKNKWYVAAWSSIYRREFLLSNNLFFKKGILHEDEEFAPRVFLSANSIVCIDEVFYHYIIRDNSITTSKNKIKNAKDIFETCRELDCIYQGLDNAKLKKLLMTHSAKICFGVIEEAKLYLKENRNIIDRKILKKNCIFFKEKIRWLLLCINPRLLHKLNKQ